MAQFQTKPPLSDSYNYEGKKESKGFPVVDSNTGQTCYITDTPATISSSRFGVYRLTPVTFTTSTICGLTEILASSDWTLSGGNLLTCNTSAVYKFYISTHFHDLTLTGGRASGWDLFINAGGEGNGFTNQQAASSPGAIDSVVTALAGAYAATDTTKLQIIERSGSTRLISGEIMIVRLT